MGETQAAPRSPSWRRRRAQALVTAAAAAALVVSAGAAAEAAPTVSATSPTGPASALRWRTVHLRGADGAVSYEIAIPRFSGTPVAPAVNQRVRVAALEAVREGARELVDDVPVRLAGASTVTTGDGRTVQVALTCTGRPTGAALPAPVVRTVVLDAATGDPITLDQVFHRPTAAYRALAGVVREIAERQGEPLAEPAVLAPRSSQWAAWQTAPAGMVFSVGAQPLTGHGPRRCTVPWSAVLPLMTPTARTLLAPSRV